MLSKKINTFVRLDNGLKKDFIKAFFYTAVARVYILFVPFNKLRKKMGSAKAESPEDVSIEDYKKASRISWVVNVTANHTPWESLCLVQALTAQWMLKPLGVSSTIYLGVKKDEQGKMIAHAWTRCGKYFITGGSNKGGFVVVAKFAS